MPDIIRSEEDVERRLSSIPMSNNSPEENQKELRESFREFFREQIGADISVTDHDRSQSVYASVRRLFFSVCFVCSGVAIWRSDNLLYPGIRTAEPSHADMPADMAADYEEARNILDKSPRGAAALLRLAIQKLCIHLGLPGKSIDADIAALVKAGLDQRIQQALDAVRVIGNESVHPGSLDMKDDRDTASELFMLVNFIVEDRIGKEKRVNAIYQKLPDGKRKAINDRDRKP